MLTGLGFAQISLYQHISLRKFNISFGNLQNWPKISRADFITSKGLLLFGCVNLLVMRLLVGLK